MRKNWLRIIIITTAVLAAAGGLVFYRFIRAGKSGETKVQEQDSTSALDRTFTLRREPLTIGFRISGNVTANKKHKLSLQANYKTTLLSVVDENTKVRAGTYLPYLKPKNCRNALTNCGQASPIRTRNWLWP